LLTGQIDVENPMYALHKCEQ